MKIRNGDHVVIISGKDKGKTGAVLRVLSTKNRLVIAGINMRIKHVRGTPQQPGQRLEYEASIAASNVMLIDPKTKKRTRMGFQIDEKGHKKRIAKKSGEVLPTKKAGATTTTKKAVAKAAGKKEKKKIEETKETEETKGAKETQEVKKPPAKKPFWKRVISFGSDVAEEGEGTQSPKDHSIPKDTPPPHRSTSRGS